MAVNTIYTGLKTGFQDLVDAIEKWESVESLEKKRNDIIDLTNVARQLNVLDHERAESLRKLEQVDIQNRIVTLGQLLELQKLVNESAVEELSKKFEAVKLGANLMETEFLKKVALLQQENEEMRNRLTGFGVAFKPEIADCYKKFHIFVKFETKTYHLFIAALDCLWFLKEEIENQLQLDRKFNYYLKYAGKILHDESMMMSDYNIRPDSVVWVLPNYRGD